MDILAAFILWVIASALRFACFTAGVYLALLTLNALGVSV